VTGAAIVAAAGLLIVGLVLRATVPLLLTLYVPASVVAGLIGLVVVRVAPERSGPLVAEFSGWPGVLIAIVFAGLLLEVPPPGGFAAVMRRGARSGVLAWIIILGQIAIGLSVYLLAVPKSVPATFGQLLEVSWAGGFGSATGMGAIFARQGFAEGRDLAFALATVGLVYGVVCGLVLVNLAIRRGWLATTSRGPLTEASTRRTPRGEGMIEPLAVAVLVLAAAYAGGWLLQRGFAFGVERLAARLSDEATRAEIVRAANNVPLFLFTLLGGGLVRRTMTLLGIDGWIDSRDVNRLLGVAMEFLIVAGIASMRLESLGRFGWPVAMLLVGAAAWSVFCLLWLSPRLLPRAYWFELGLLNFGFSTANTPQGMMLLRIVDPHLRSGAAGDYATAAPLSAPFVGGGVITFVGLPLLLGRVGAGPVLVGVLVLMIALYVAGRSLGRSETPA
jgi:glutamate:Na+ symporter, ESS family